MKSADKKIGKRFSQIDVVEYRSDDGEHLGELQKIADEGNFSRAPKHYAEKAERILRERGINVDAMLIDSPNGSGIRDFIFNQKGEQHDSVIALASQVLELSLHVLGYQSAHAPGNVIEPLAYRLGRLAMLLDVYEFDEKDHAKRRKGKPSNDPDDTGRDSRIRDFHSKWIKSNGSYGAIKQTAREFDLSEKQISRILKSVS